jgi:hypothetical protein
MFTSTLKKYGLDNIIPQYLENDTLSQQDPRFLLGERLIQNAIHSATNKDQLNNMRARIQGLLQTPNEKETDPLFTGMPESQDEAR